MWNKKYRSTAYHLKWSRDLQLTLQHHCGKAYNGFVQFFTTLVKKEYDPMFVIPMDLELFMIFIYMDTYDTPVVWGNI